MDQSGRLGSKPCVLLIQVAQVMISTGRQTLLEDEIR